MPRKSTTPTAASPEQLTPPAAEPAAAGGSLIIPPIRIIPLRLRLVGLSPLICHAWSQKAKSAMLDKQMGKARAKKEPKDPEADFLASFYRLPDGRPAFPTLAFKAAAVGASRQIEGLKMTFLRGAFHVQGELVAIESPNPARRREDIVRLQGGVADIRFRPEFDPWAVTLPVNLNATSMTLEQLVHLFNMGGFSQGVGEWRPERDGSFGMFRVESVEQLPEEAF